MIHFGTYYKNGSPKTINKTIGYRTKMSMINNDTWQFAHNYWADISGKIGRFLIPIPIIPILFFFFVFNDDTTNIDIMSILVIIILAIEVIAYFFAIFLTEKALKRTFDSSGERIK